MAPHDPNSLKAVSDAKGKKTLSAPRGAQHIRPFGAEIFKKTKAGRKGRAEEEEDRVDKEGGQALRIKP
jgi:hypothetical protein